MIYVKIYLESILRVLERDIIWQQWVVAPILISILAAIGAWEDTDIWDNHFCYFPSVLITTEHELLIDWMHIAYIVTMKYCNDIPHWRLNSSHKKSNEGHIVQSRKVLCHWKLLPAHRAVWSPILFLHFGLHRAHHSGSQCIIVHQWKSPVCECCKVAAGST